jgi:hypothetical protein
MVAPTGQKETHMSGFKSKLREILVKSEEGQQYAYGGGGLLLVVVVVLLFVVFLR